MPTVEVQECSCLIYSQCGVTLDATINAALQQPLREMYWLSSLFITT